MNRTILAAAAAALTLTSCANDADVASRNLSTAADNFEIPRRIVFYNGITGEYILTIEGLCSQQPDGKKLAVVCKTGRFGWTERHAPLRIGAAAPSAASATATPSALTTAPEPNDEIPF